MNRYLSNAIIGLVGRFSLGFLREDPYAKMERMLEKKIRRMAGTGIGKELGITTQTRQKKLALTSYDQYRKYYEKPEEGDFLYSLGEYLLVTTSGTMSLPKKYLLPKAALSDNMRKTLLAKILLYTHDGEKVTFQIGDTMYANLPGGTQISSHYVDIGGKQSSFFMKNCPDPNMPFDAKVDYFVEHHREIDIAYMTIPTLLDDVIPRVGEKLSLKGFVVQDSAAAVYKDKIREVTGSYPKVSYGSTEALACSVPSIQHPGSFIMDWRVVYPEFIPLDETEAPPEDSETVKLSEVEKGRRYRFVVTPYLTEIHKYLMPDVFECISHGDDCLGTDLPVFKYYSRGDKLVVLHNFTRIAEEELLQVMRDSGMGYVDFTARRETDGYRDHLKIYVELTEEKPVQEVHRSIGEALAEFDRDWRDLVEFLKYDPLKVELLPRGSFKRYLARQSGMYRVDRVQMRDEKLDLLLSK
jgi:hypothetical protein